jgi:hypothetical protein
VAADVLAGAGPPSIWKIKYDMMNAFCICVLSIAKRDVLVELAVLLPRWVDLLATCLVALFAAAPS